MFFKVLLSKPRTAGAWIREGYDPDAVKVKSWFVVGFWVKAGDGFEAAKAKIRETEAIRSTSMVVFSISSKVFSSNDLKKMVSNKRVSLSFQSCWLFPHASFLAFQLCHRRYAKIGRISTIIFIGLRFEVRDYN
ncbi:hypothetical protein V6N13_039791 [Hibiscus sabdariffa]